MNMQTVDYLIIGGGVAGTTAAETIRKLDANAAITIISDEPHPLYSRVLLPHYIRGKVKRDFVFLKKPEWYDEHHITLLSGNHMAAFRPAEHLAVLASGVEYRYRKLLFATGGRVRTLEVPDLHGITYFRTMQDADRIVSLLNEVAAAETRGRACVVYGGGFIGLEFLQIFRERGLETHLAIRERRYWEHLLDAESSTFLAKMCEAQDIHLHTGVDYVKVSGSERLRGVDIQNTRINACMLGIGIGLEPNLGVAQIVGVKTNRGIVTNEYLETSAPDVYAAGDIAEFYDVTVDRARVVGNWMNAQQQGMGAARNMIGERTRFELVSSYATTPFGKTMIFLGDVERLPGTEVILRGSVADGGVEQIFIRDSKVVGATLINMARDRTPLTELIKRRTEIRGLEQQLADCGIELGTLVR